MIATVVSCPGCGRAVSEWAARCPACGSDVAEGVVLVDEDWDLPGRISPVLAGQGSTRRGGLPIRGAGIALTVAVLAAVLIVGNLIHHRSSSTHQELCAAPTATWAPGRPTSVGALGAARVGPFTFSPAYSGPPGTPTRVIVHSVIASTAALTMTGWSCSTGRPFRFWYPPYGSYGDLPQPVNHAPGEGALSVTVPVLGAGDNYLGYMLFPSPGRWDVELWNARALVGNILFVLPKT